MKKNNSGFSLVELIIVIAIMAVLIGVLAPQFIKYVERSRESTDLQNIEEYKTAIETYVADNSDKVTGTVDLTITGGAGGSIKSSVDLTSYGLTNTTETKPLKSAKWTITTSWQYDTATYKWNKAEGSATYFNLDGTDATSAASSS